MVKSLFVIIVGFLFGVLVHSVFFPEFVLGSEIIYLFSACLIFSLLSWRFPIKNIVFFLIFFVFGLWRFSSSIDLQEGKVLDVFVDQGTSLGVAGVISSDVIKKRSYQEFTLSVDSLVSRAAEFPVDTQILVRSNGHEEYQYGQRVSVFGQVESPQAFITDTDRIFRYDYFLKKDGVHYVMSFADMEILAPPERSLQHVLFSIKHKLLGTIYRYVPSPGSGLLAGVLFGQKAALGDEITEQFRRVGLMHIVVLSGYNVSIVILLFMKVFSFLPKSLRAVLATMSIVAFALLVGAGPTVIRASIMALFIVLAELINRPYNIRRALLLAGAVMVLWNPYVLYFDISFQLSFLATYGLIVLAPYLDKKFAFLPSVFAIRESAVATISAQIMVLPLLLYAIGEFSLISPLVNVLVLFAVPWSMGLGFLVSVIGSMVPFVTTTLSFIVSLMLDYQLWIVSIFSRIPFAVITIPQFSWWWVLCMYLGIFYWVRSFEKEGVRS